MHNLYMVIMVCAHAELVYKIRVLAQVREKKIVREAMLQHKSYTKSCRGQKNCMKSCASTVPGPFLVIVPILKLN